MQGASFSVQRGSTPEAGPIRRSAPLERRKPQVGDWL
jgi:hypothetical protein